MDIQECCLFTKFIRFWVRLQAYFTIYKAPPLPDNAVLDILGRLPTQDVSIFRRVCKKWLELTSTADFAHFHHQKHSCCNTEKVLLLQCGRMFKEIKHPTEYKYMYDSFFILNKEAKGKRIFKKMIPDLNRLSENFPILYGSCNGIIVFRAQFQGDWNYLLNPTTQERINVWCNKGVFFCGFFYHPLKKEYIMLLNRASVVADMVDYFLFSVESESLRKICTFPYFSSTNQVYSNGSLYWRIDYESNNTCDHSVMAFNVRTEGFRSFPHPHKQCGPKCERKDMSLLENNGQLLICRKHQTHMDMWVLGDDENNIWVKRYVVHLDWDLKLFPFEANYAIKPTLLVLNVDNGELLLFWITRGFFAYNLEENTVRKIDLRGIKIEEKLGWVNLAHCYVKSLVSLKVSMKYPNHGKFPTCGQIIIDLE